MQYYDLRQRCPLYVLRSWIFFTFLPESRGEGSLTIPGHKPNPEIQLDTSLFASRSMLFLLMRIPRASQMILISHASSWRDMRSRACVAQVASFGTAPV